MLRDRIGSAMEIDHGVAVFAAIIIRRSGELVVMRVFVAIRTLREFHFVNGVFARRNMALGAIHLDVFALQGILRSAVLVHAKQRRLPAIQRVALRAFALLRPRLELPLVRVGLMAIDALRKGNLLLEIPVQVTGHAGNFLVFA